MKSYAFDGSYRLESDFELHHGRMPGTKLTMSFKNGKMCSSL